MSPSLRLLVPLFLLCSLAVNAQNRRAHAGIGLKLGPQAATYRAPGYNFQPVPGGVIGLYAPWWVASQMELQLEVLGSMQGASFTPAEGDPVITRTYYLQVPLSAKLFLGNEFNLQLGGYLGQLMAATTDGVADKASFHAIDGGLNMGVGIDKLQGFDLTLRYVYGLTNVMKDDNAIFPTTRCLQLTAGWRLLRFRKKRG